MGIQGLTSFIDENPHLLIDHHLHDTKVVIDGNNLYHFLYHHFSVNPQFGGDYDIFAENVKFYFQRLSTCGIVPYVIFDGAYTADDKKLKTALKRANDRVRLAGLLAGGQRAKILPILAYETFRCVLDELSIKHVTCDFEADNQLAALANHWNCPVLSNDSDFFIFDIPGGFILFDYINLQICGKVLDSGSEVNYIKVQIYYLDTLLNCFKDISRDMIPLFGTLLGNDYVPREEFEGFFARANLPKPDSRLFSVPKRHRKMLSLLQWLETKTDLNDTVETCIGFVKKERREHVRKLITISISEYTNLKSSFVDFFISEKSSFVGLCNLKTQEGNLLPDWFMEQVRIGFISALCLNAVVSHRIILLTQVETMDQQSSYGCAVRLRQILYSILLSIESNNGQGVAVVEYDRDGNSLRKNRVVSINADELDPTLPLLYDLPCLPIQKRMEYLLQWLNIPKSLSVQLKEFLSQEAMALPVFTLKYWIENAFPKISKVQFKALALCCLKNHFASIEWKNIERETACRVTSCPTDQELEKVKEHLAKFNEPQKLSSYQSKITHAFSQYQACLQAAMYLNQILLCPIPNPNPADIFSGSFLYNLCRELQHRKCPDLYIEELLGRSSTILKGFNHFISLLLQSFSSSDVFEEQSSSGKKSKNKVKKHRGKDNKKRVHSYVEESESEQNTSQGEDAKQSLIVQPCCDVHNKFSILQIDES